MAGRIYITGDTHGVLGTYKISNFQEKSNEKLDYNDYLIICGDAGIVWEKDTLAESIDYFEHLGTNILFVDGNHENFDMLKKYQVSSWNGGNIHKISQHIYHLIRGEIFNIFGKTFLAIGGAKSSDIEYRKEHITWWKDEEITYNDFLNAIENLALYGNRVDYVISHTQPNSILKELEEMLTACGERIPYYLIPKLNHSLSNEILEEILKKIKYGHWFSGHLHIDENLHNNTIIYNSIIKVI